MRDEWLFRQIAPQQPARPRRKRSQDGRPIPAPDGLPTRLRGHPGRLLLAAALAPPERRPIARTQGTATRSERGPSQRTCRRTPRALVRLTLADLPSVGQRL